MLEAEILFADGQGRDSLYKLESKDSVEGNYGTSNSVIIVYFYVHNYY